MIESEIAQKLNVDQSTISRDIKALKQMSQQFVFDLAKSDLAYYYQQCINGIEEVRRKAIADTKRQTVGFEINKGMRRRQICVVQRWTIYSECKITRRANISD